MEVAKGPLMEVVEGPLIEVVEGPLMEVVEGPLMEAESDGKPVCVDATEDGASTASSTPSQLQMRVNCKQAAVRSVRFSADGCFCITCGSDKSLKLWNPHRVNETGSCTPLKVYMGHGNEVLDAQGACDNGRIVSCGADRSVLLWDVTSARQLNKWRGHHGAVTAVRFCEDSSLIVSGSVDSSVKAWDCRSRRPEPVQSLDHATDSVTSLQVSDHEIVTGSADGRVRRYDLRNARLTTDAVGEAVSCVTLSRDGQCLLVGCMDASLKLLDKETGELLNSYRGHRNAKYPLASCLDAADTRVLSGSEDGRVYCWDLVTAQLAGTLQHPPGTGTVHALSFHPHQSCLLTAAGGDIYMWTAG